MSTVPPDAPLDEPPPALLLLPLLLQPAAARATAASAAAIAGVRFNTFMIFLSFGWLALRPRSTPTDPVWASWQCDSRGICRTPTGSASTSRLHHAHAGVRSTGSVADKSFPLSCVRSRREDLRRTPPSPPNSRTMGMGSSPPAAVGLRHVRLDPAVLARESMPDSCIAEINRKITNRSPPGCRGSILRPDLTTGTGNSRHVAGVRVRATMRACDVPSSPARMIGRNDTTHEPCHSLSSAIGVLSVACGAGLRR